MSAHTGAATNGTPLPTATTAGVATAVVCVAAAMAVCPVSGGDTAGLASGLDNGTSPSYEETITTGTRK